jgi:hypothetical protein
VACYDGLTPFQDAFGVYSTHYARHEPTSDNFHNYPHHVSPRKRRAPVIKFSCQMFMYYHSLLMKFWNLDNERENVHIYVEKQPKISTFSFPEAFKLIIPVQLLERGRRQVYKPQYVDRTKNFSSCQSIYSLSTLFQGGTKPIPCMVRLFPTWSEKSGILVTA